MKRLATTPRTEWQAYLVQTISFRSLNTFKVCDLAQSQKAKLDCVDCDTAPSAASGEPFSSLFFFSTMSPSLPLFVHSARVKMPARRIVALFVAFVLSIFFIAALHHRSSLLPGNGWIRRWRRDAPRYIFVDLGTNSADSLEAFLRHDGAKFSYEFPRPDWATYEQAGE